MSTKLEPSAEVLDEAPRALKNCEPDKGPALTGAELEAFRCWLDISMASLPAQLPMPANLRFSGSGCLAEMIEAVHEALRGCLAGLEDCNARSRRHWRQAKVRRQCGHINEPDRETITLQSEIASWGRKIGWLQKLCLSLEREQASDKAPIPSDIGNGRACA